MPRVLLFRLLLSVVLLACFARVFYIFVAEPPTGVLPFQVEQQGAQFAVHAAPGVPLPAPLANGQIVDLKGMSILDRAAIHQQRPLPVGTRVTIAVQQQGQSVPARFVAMPSPPEQLGDLERWLGIVIITTCLAAALLTLWRGRDWTAWGLCMFFSEVIVENGALDVTAPPAASLWMEPALTLLRLLGLTSLYVMARSLAGHGLPRTWRTFAPLSVAGGTFAVGAVGIAQSILFYYSGVALPGWLRSAGLAVVGVLVAIAVLTLIIGYRGAGQANRRRMRWVLFNTVLLVGSNIVEMAAKLSADTQPLLFAIFHTMLPGLAVLGYLYAILSTRVVDVGFVIDRALVFSMTTALMFGLFALLEDAVHELALGGELSWAVQALGAVAVAAALSPLHRLLDRWLERLFFHRLRTIAGALRRLARESAFFEDEQALLARVLRQLLAPCSAAAIYERHGAVYQLRVAAGDRWPQAVDRDDPAFVALRAEHGALELRGIDSAAGAEGLAFPMRAGQLLTGAVLVRLREGEQLDRDVRSALGELAHALGTSLYLLRYQEQARLLAEIAAGRVDQAAVRSRVEALPGA